jgi:2-polyprenyl-3-methyl-5-hydroxy-6-metoxy-1,4-benzoquinol methylase
MVLILPLASTRNQQIQADMTYRALELLNLPPDQPAYLLDIGCGSGLSGEILDEEGYIWTGVDIAPSMLGTYASLVECCTLTNFPVSRRSCPRT